MTAMVSFEALVHIEAGEPFTNTLHIAKGLNIPHASVIKLVRKYKSDFDEFGRIGFEIQLGSPLPQGGFGRATEYALLNEGQATLLLTYMRNTDRVRQFKIALVKAFLAAKNLINTDYMSLAKKHAVLNVELESERELASFSGHSLSMWKQKSKYLKAAIEQVEQQMQPCLDFG